MTCQNGNCKYTVTNKLPAPGHNWKDETVEPTCTAEGSFTRTCQNDGCTVVYEEIKEKLPHDMIKTEEVVAPTCEKEGYTVYKCETCTYTEKHDYVQAVGHSYKAVETNGWHWAADYSSAEMAFVCENNADHVLNKSASVNFTVFTLVCSEGYSKTTYTASLRYGESLYSDTKEVVKGAISHDYSDKWISDETQHWHKCVCGDTIDQFAHSFAPAWTCDETHHWRICECGRRDGFAVHSFENPTVTTEPACIYKGETTAYCVCGDTEVTPMPATGEHNYENGYCVVCGKNEITGQVSFVDAYTEEGLMAWYDGANNANGRQNPMASVWKDLSGHGNHLDLSGAVSAGNVYWSDNALIIDTESGCYIRLPDAITELINGDAYTVEIVYGDVDYSATNYITLFSSANDELMMFIRCSETDPDSESYMKLEYKNGDVNGDGNRPWVSDAWKYIDGRTFAFTADLNALDNGEDTDESPDRISNVFLYADGTRIAAGQSVYAIGADSLYLGHTAASRRWGGEIYAIRIYNRALTQEELAANAQADEKNYRNGTLFVPVGQYDPSLDEEDGCPHNLIKTDMLRMPTCGDLGLKEMTCVECNATRTAKIPATGDHDFVNGYCTVCEAEHDCRFEGPSYKLLGKSCEEGVENTRTCACGATEIEMFYTHNPVDSELFMMANEGCGGQFGIRRCICGAYAQFFLQNNRHRAMGTSSPNPDGSGYVTSYACTQCALSWVDTACYEKTDDPCTMACSITRKMVFDGQTIWEKSLETLEMRHPYAESAKLAEGATSCEDGVIVTYTCTECGDTYTNEIDWHYRFVLETIDFNAIEGACGGILVQEGCACGAERGLNWNDRFACCWTTSTKTHTDESGKEITVYTNICEECGLTWTETEYYKDIADADDACRKQRIVHVVYTLNGEYLGEVNSNIERTPFHQLKYEFSFAEGATSCKDGVTVTTTCTECDGTWENTYDHHQYFEVESVDLWRELKACGGYLVSEACPCGEFARLCWYEVPCEFETADDGISRVCTECGLTVVETDTTRTGKNFCETIHQHKITVSMGEDSYSMSQEWIETDHCFGGQWEGEVKSCVDSNLTVTLVCIRCGESGGKITVNDHVSLAVQCLDFKEVGGCGGEFCVYR